MWNLGQLHENFIFSNYCSIKVRIYKIILHICDTYNCDYLQDTTFRFYLIDFQFNADFPFQLCVFYSQIIKRYSKIGFPRKYLKKKKKKKTRRFFSRKTVGSYSNWKQFQVFKIAKFEFKVTVHYSPWARCTQLWPLKTYLLFKTISICLHFYINYKLLH